MEWNILEPFWVMMAWEHRISLPQIPFSNVKTVSCEVFSFAEQRQSQIKSSLKYIVGYTRDASTERWGKFFYKLKMLSDYHF